MGTTVSERCASKGPVVADWKVAGLSTATRPSGTPPGSRARPPVDGNRLFDRRGRDGNATRLIGGADEEEVRRRGGAEERVGGGERVESGERFGSHVEPRQQTVLRRVLHRTVVDHVPGRRLAGRRDGDGSVRIAVPDVLGVDGGEQIERQDAVGGSRTDPVRSIGWRSTEAQCDVTGPAF